MNDVDQLLRDTLAGRAATVTEPILPARIERHRRAWPAALAAAAAVVLVGGGLAAWQLAPTSGEQPAAGGTAASCTTTLPQSWAAATATQPLHLGALDADSVPTAGSVDGGLAGSSAAVGDAVESVAVRTHDGQTFVVAITGRSGGSPQLALPPSWDGRYLVVATAPRIPAHAPDSPVDDIRVVDTVKGGRLTHALAKAPMPRGWVVARGDVVVTGGVVYWGAVPTATSTSGIVLSYDIARNRYAVQAHTPGYPTVVADPRGGVAWPNGHAGRIIAPPAVPAIVRSYGAAPSFVVTDGREWAWTDYEDNGLKISWAAADGVVTSYVVDPIPGSRLLPSLSATAGPYVFFGLNEHGDDTYVLDTRTGAVAPTGHTEYVSITPGRLFERDGQDAPFHEVDVQQLPELRCR